MKTLARTLLLLFSLLPLIPRPGEAQTLIEARITIDPETPVIDQWCRLELVIETGGATALRDLRLAGFPDTGLLALSPMVEHPIDSRRRDGQTVEIRRYSARVRPQRAGLIRFRPTLHATLSQRASSGFATRWIQRSVTHHLPEVLLRVRPWPESGQPPEFTGAVGNFSFSGEIDPPDPALGDLVRLTLRVEGQGWLGDALPHFDPVPPDLPAYPARELQRAAESGMIIERLFVITNAAAISLPGAVFAWFDPQTQAYRQARTGPFSIEPRQPDDALPPTTHLRFDAPAGLIATPPEREFRLPQIDRLARLEAWSIGFGVLVVFIVLSRLLPIRQARSTRRNLMPASSPMGPSRRREPSGEHTSVAQAAAPNRGARKVRDHMAKLSQRLPMVLRVLGLAAALATGWHLDTRARRVIVTLERDATARLAPSDLSLALTEWPAGQRLRVLAHHGNWTRVGQNGAIAWVPTDALR